jgi:hypothetical protein
MSALRIVSICTLLIVTSITRADAETMPFSAFSASYRGEAKGIKVGDLGTRTLTQLGPERFQIQYTAKALMYTLKEISVFDWVNGAPKPISYDSSRGTFLKRRENHIDFDWQNNTASYIHKKNQGTFPLIDGVQDPLTSLLVLAQALQSGKPTISLHEAKNSRHEEKRFALLGTPMLKTKIGNIKTYHLQRLHDDPERHTELWLHYEHPFIPVKVRQTDEGDLFLLELTTFTLN